MVEKPRVSLARPTTQFDPKPEVWYIIDTEINYLVYLPELVSSRLISYQPSDSGFKFETLNTIYFCDWAPTLRRVTKEQLNKVCNNILKI